MIVIYSGLMGFIVIQLDFIVIQWDIPSGKQLAIEHGPVEIVDLPIEHGDFQ